MKIRFLTRQVFRTGRPDGDTIYEEGRVYDLRDDQARRWLRRDVAVFVSEEDEPSATVSSSKGPSHTPPEDRAPRGTNLDDPGVDAPRPDAMTTADIQLSRRQPSDTLDGMLREDLLELAQERGVDLGPGYHRKEDLIAALRAKSDD